MTALQQGFRCFLIPTGSGKAEQQAVEFGDLWDLLRVFQQFFQGGFRMAEAGIDEAFDKFSNRAPALFDRLFRRGHEAQQPFHFLGGMAQEMAVIDQNACLIRLNEKSQ